MPNYRLRRFPPSIVRAGRGLLTALGTSFVLLALAYAVLADAPNPSGSWTTDRWRALLDAVLAGLIGFIAVGGFTFLFSLKPPEEETLERRIAYLYSARQRGGPDGEVFLRSQVRILGAMITTAKATFSAVEFLPDKSLLRMSVSVSMTISNMMRFDRYTQATPLRIAAEDIAKSVKDIGTLHSVRTRSFREDGTYEQETNWLQHPRKLTHVHPYTQIDIDIDIPPGGWLEYDYAYEVWQPIPDECWFGANRFIEQADVHFANVTGAEFNLTPYLPPKALGARTLPGTIKVKPNEIVKLGRFRGIPPTEDVTFSVSAS